MRILAVNTASPRLSLALIEGDDDATNAKILFQHDVEEPRDQGNFLLHAIDAGLRECGIAYQDLDLMAAVTGPGSFTGIRIGLAAMRGFALAADVPIAGLNSFDLFSATVPVNTAHHLTVMESWRDELYFQLDASEPFNVAPAQCLEDINGIDPQNITLMGDALEKMSAFLPGAAVERRIPDAADLARLMLIRPDLRLQDAVPFYLRPPDVSFGSGNRKLQSQ